MQRRTFLAAGAGLCFSSAAYGQITPPAQPRAAFPSALAYSAAQGPSAVLIARHGIVMAEAYTGSSAATAWDLGEAGRVFSTILAAALVKDRALNLSEPVAMTLGDWGADPVKSTITIRALLNGTSGLGTDRHRDDLSLADALALSPEAAPGQRFIDDPAPYILFGEIAQRKLQARGADINIASFLAVRALEDVRCSPVAWTRTRDGAPNLNRGMQTNLRAFAQAGELLRRDGIFRAQQILDPETVREARQGSFAERRAGMGLWLTGGVRGDAPDMEVESDLWRTTPGPWLDLAMAAGVDGQRLYIAPSEGLLIARLGRDGRNWSDAAFIGAVMSELA